MAYGLRIINDDSELLIDSDYLNPTFVQKLEFDTTPTLVEAASGFIHPGYIKREYKTTNTVSMGVTGMAYVVMWTLPDNGANDIYYNFDTSIAYLNEKLTCFVYANSTGNALTYTLPTAYVFAVTPAGINTLNSTGPALRMYNSAGQKTFDSNLVQLAPYSITDTFAFSIAGTNPNNYGTTPVSINLSIPTNPIFMLPDFHALRINKGPENSIAHQEYLYQTAFRRIGSTLYTRLYVVDYYNEDYAWPLTQTTFTSGNNNQLSIIVADANLYEAVSAGGGGGGSNPTYTLSSNFTSRDEGTTVVVTLNTTLVADYTEFFYTVTGVAAADLSTGGVTGKFIILNNTASASFTFANDLLTEGTETFILGLDGLTQSVSVTVNDTSKAGTFSWSTPGNVNEGSTGFTTFNATNANGKVVTFSVIAPSTGTSVSGSSDGALLTSSWTVSGDAPTSINVQYSAVADSTTEGPEAFRIVATVDGVPYTSNDIIVNDTSKTIGYSVSAADNWDESGTYAVTIGANNVNGTTLYLTTDNALVTPSSSTVTVNSDTFTVNVNYTAGIVTTNTTVRLHVRTGSATGTIQAFKDIILTNVASSYSFGTVAAFNEGSSGSVQFNYSYAANKSVTFSVAAPTSGTSGVSDVTLNTTTHSIGATNASGNVSVTYSAAADTTTEGPEYFRIAATVDGSTYYSNNITINDTSLTPTPTYVLTRSVASVNEGGSFSITFATNQAGSFAYTITGVSSADISGASLTGTVSNGSTLNYTVASDATTEGSETFSISLNNGLSNTPTVTFNDTSLTPAPTYSLTRSTASVNEGGSFTITFATNQAGSFAYTITGVSSADIGGASLTGSVSNGSVLSYNVTADTTTEGSETFSITLNNGLSNTPTVTINDTSLTAPSYSLGNTWNGQTIANGTILFFYLRSTNASGVTVNVSKSGTGSSRVTIDPTSFTIAGNGQTDTYIQVTTSNPSSPIAQQSVTISLSTGQSFSFNIQAVTEQIPWVTSVVDTMFSPIYYNGETITYAINMASPITASTQVRVSVWTGVTVNGTGGTESRDYYIFTGGQPISGVNGFFPLGAMDGYYTTIPNPGLNTRVVVKARTVSAGNVQPTDIVGTVRELRSDAPP
jgi:hypothetical protein